MIEAFHWKDCINDVTSRLMTSRKLSSEKGMRISPLQPKLILIVEDYGLKASIGKILKK